MLRPLLSILTVVLAAAALLWVAVPAAPVQSQATKPAAASANAQALPGASKQRLYLTQAQSREATRRGLLPPGTRSILATGGTLNYGDWRWDDAGVPKGRLAVRVDLDRQLVSVFVGPHEVGTAVILYGANGKDTPRGRLPILGKTRDHHSRTYDAPMPYSLWLRSDGVALHGSTIRSGRATNGCIGVPVEFAGKLFALARKGDIIEVIGAPPTARR